MERGDFDRELEKVIEKDSRYPKEAYYFVREALAFTQKKFGRLNAVGEEHHVTGQELLEGIREYALSEFGPMTLTVFDEWGIRRCEDFGEIVFNLVDASLLGKTEQDSKDDFKGGYDFEEAFKKPFLPSSKLNKN
ncbi:MAG: hypothetical protein N2487_04410 [Verrucomicrobiae bacterium]|nr:hypothetical protein [Verrucomicrobiae bacterium]